MDDIDALALVALAPPSLEDWFPLVHSWLERAETIGAAYQAWEELRSKYANATQSHAQKSAALKLHGEFVLGAAQQAQAEVFQKNAPAGLSPSGVGESRQRLESISQMWIDAHSQMSACFEKASQEIEQEIVRRIDKTLLAVRPKLRLSIHHIGQEHCVLQFERIDELTSVLLSRLVSGKIPTRHAFFFDDSVSQAGGAAELTYAELPACAPIQQPPWPFIRALVSDEARLSAPWKGQIPILCEGDVLWMLKPKGIVMEVEQVSMEEAQASAVLEVAKAQRVVAYFFKWMHEGKMELQLQPN
jgi:hypothetical protein